MNTVVVSVFLLFALIFLGLLIGKRGIVRQECTPDLSNLILQVTMPVTAFCSVAGRESAGMFGFCMRIFAAVALVQAFAGLMGLLMVRVLSVPDEEKGVWIYSCIMSNNGFMSLPLAMSLYGDEGVFLMALGNVVTNFLIFSLGLKLLTWKYPIRDKISLKKMLLNNINIAVVIGLVFCFAGIPVPETAGQLLEYISSITSGLSMLVVGLSLSRMPFRAVFEDRKMFLLAAVRLLFIPVIVLLILKILPMAMDGTLVSILILIAALPTSSAQCMITEQYRTNASAAGRSVFITTLFSVVTVPFVMLLADI